MSKEEHGMMNADEVKELLEAFSEKCPTLLNSLTDAIYGKDASAKFGAAVACRRIVWSRSRRPTTRSGQSDASSGPASAQVCREPPGRDESRLYLRLVMRDGDSIVLAPFESTTSGPR